MAASMGLKADASNKEIEEAMKRVREAQSLISAAIEPSSEFINPRTQEWISSSFAEVQKSELCSFLFQVKKTASASILAPDPGLDPDAGDPALALDTGTCRRHYLCMLYCIFTHKILESVNLLFISKFMEYVWLLKRFIDKIIK